MMSYYDETTDNLSSIPFQNEYNRSIRCIMCVTVQYIVADSQWIRRHSFALGKVDTPDSGQKWLQAPD
jgi:hypothetical protein